MSIEIPERLRSKLGPEVKMDVHLIDVELLDGRTFKNIVVRGGRYITGFESDPGGEGLVSFTATDIKDITRTSSLPRLIGRLLTLLGRVVAGIKGLRRD